MNYEEIVARMGEAYVRRRFMLQAHYVARVIGPGLVHFHVENLLWAHYLLRRFLQTVRLHGRGQANALRFEITRNEVAWPGLPPAFAGFRILHLSDLHADFHPAFAERLAAAVAGLDYDAVALTGDYRMHTTGNFDPAMAGLRAIRAALRGPVFAVLGNHDFLEMIPVLEDMGVRLLLNENEPLRRGADTLHVVGVDDPHFYRAAELKRAMAGVPPAAPVLLLAHSPELHEQARQAGVRLMLCGHTHGGQICLPGGRAILTNARCPRALVAGAWRRGGLQGYTSRGTGSSGLDVRYNCPPEIVVHRLTAAS